MFALGFTVNTLTLMAMTLAIGLVVDDAIVVLENIHRHIEDGIPPVRAAIQGMSELSTAVIAMTLTLAAVFAPVAFAPGRTGKLFTEFALSLAGAVLVSGFVALTLTPMMCSKILRHHERHGRVYVVLEHGFERLAARYRVLLGGALRVRPMMVLLWVAVAAASGLIFTQLKSELSPIEDRGVIRVIGIGPEGATPDYMTRYVSQFEPIFRATPEVAGFFAVAGFPEVNNAVGFGRLKPWEQRDRKQQAIAAELQPRFFRNPGLLAFVNNPPSLGQSFGSRPIEFVVQTSGSYRDLEGYVETLMTAAAANPSLVNLDTDLKLNKPQIEIEIDRDKAADAGVAIETIGRTLETLLGSRQVTRFNRDSEQYDVVLQLADADRRTPETLNTIWVRGRDGTMVQLSNLVRFVETVAPKELNRFNQLRAATIQANLAPGYTVGEGLAFLEQTARTQLPPGTQTDYSGQSREFKQSGASLYFIFLLALGFIYLVLAAQFESFVDPFIIMLTVPLSMTGALLALYLAGSTLNLYSQIGLVTLVGLITKHGILIVEFANQLQDQGRSVREAVIEAATLRFRPILMTTGAMVLGAVPLALATGAGAESRQPIGWVIVGGMLLGTLLTLFVVPSAYTYLARRRAPAAHAVAAPAE
jgi:multidrug efflux pump